MKRVCTFTTHTRTAVKIISWSVTLKICPLLFHMDYYFRTMADNVLFSPNSVHEHITKCGQIFHN